MWGKVKPEWAQDIECGCGFEADRDVVGSWNIRLKALKMWGASVPPKSRPMKPETGRLPAAFITFTTAESQNRMINKV